MMDLVTRGLLNPKTPEYAVVRLVMSRVMDPVT